MSPSVRTVLDLVKTRWARHRDFALYTIIGLSGVLLDLLVFALLTHVAHVPYQVANAASTICGILNNFTLNVRYNFKVRDRLLIRFLSFLSVGLLGLLLSAGLLHLGVEFFGMHEMLAKLLTLVAVLLFQYSLNKMVTFRRSQE